eukprot:CAMPEP_0171083244 /NCGR_PEP_ID=MMETSP0766_2-20121228/17598_1 /TAXON_ID=439317 /ORGANISM="Gambierdiscus australes, Strain CAWD 149" /LENGTH=118 /DNA_ID=CAMNT_0011540667 /DNA_START=522 /DNA_END=878 /DNA_ORIENTATION=+
MCSPCVWSMRAAPPTQGQRWTHAAQLLARLRSGRMLPNVVMYGAAISACERSAAWEGAVSLLFDMHFSKVDVNVVSASAAISACEKGEQWSLASVLFNEVSTCWSWTSTPRQTNPRTA